MGRRRIPALLSGLGVGMFLLLMLARTERGIGFTYDEPVYIAVARRNGGWLREWGRAWQEGDWLRPLRPEVLDLYWHNRGPTQADRDMQPPFIKWLFLLCQGCLDWAQGWLPIYRLPAMLCWAAAVAVMVMLLGPRWGWGAAVGGSLGLAWLPRLFGHAHLMALDGPVASLTWMTTLWAWHLSDGAKPVPWQKRIPVGILWGCALATKLNALLTLPAFLLWLLLRRQAREALRWGIALLGGGLATFFLLWPWLWYDPWEHLKEYLTYHLSHYPVLVSYAGRLYTQAPWHYAPVMTAITTPLLFLLLALWGTWQGMRRGRRTRAFVGLCWLCLLAHWGPFLLPGAPKYNGVRLFLPALPPLGGLVTVGLRYGGLGLARWLRRTPTLGRYGVSPRRLIGGLAALLLLSEGVALWVYHPFYLSYYNEVIGGLAGAVRRGFEATYWGEAYLAALPILNREALPGASVYICPPGVVSILRMYQGASLLRADLRLVGEEREAWACDFLVFHHRPSEWNAVARWLFHNAQPLAAPGIGGVPLVFVYRGPLPPFGKNPRKGGPSP